MMNTTKKLKVPHLSLIVQIWVVISFLSISYCNSISESSGYIYMNYTMIAVNETYTVNVSDIEATATMASSMVNYSVPVSASPLLPSHCYRVCRCNDSVGYAATTMWYNMTANETRRANMMSVNMTANGTRIVNMTTMSVKMTSAYLSMSSDVSMSPTPSGINMLYTPSANVTRMSHNSSVWPTPSSAIHPPFVCPNESCWEEVECMSHSSRISRTRYHDTASILPTLSTVASSSAVPTECPFPVDCHGDCGGGAFRDCEVCIEGNTGVNSLRDCGGECNGTAFNSSCGICLGEGSSDPFLDCNDECYGEALPDSCGECTGGRTGKERNYLMDECGICNGTNATCAGCDDIPNSGKVLDACGDCGGNGSACTEITATIPCSISSIAPIVWVIGAGLNGGSETVCGLYNPDSGVMVNTTATERNLTHARCEFQSLVNYTAGPYSLSVTVADVKINTSLPVYIYSLSDLSVTSAIPDNVIKDDLPRLVTVIGTGFFNHSKAKIRCYYGHKESTEVIFINDTHLQCKVDAVDSSRRFHVSLSMNCGLGRVGSANLTVYARAPNVTGVKLNNLATGIDVRFDKPVYFTSQLTASETCGDLFNDETVNLLGISPDCYSIDYQEIAIDLGYNATIGPGDSVGFKDNVIKTRGEQYGRFLSGSFPVSQPDSPLKPTPVIRGPETLSSCGNLTLSGSQSFGGGGRPLKFEWVLASPNSGNDVTNIRSILNGLDDDRVKIPGTLFESGKTYVFKLKVANFLNPSSFEEVTHSITKATVPVPGLTLSSNIDLSDAEVFVSEDLSIKANAIVAPCVNNTKVDFSWTVTCSDASAKQKVESSPSFQATKNQATLKINEGGLTGDVTCTFNVTGSMNYDPSVQSTVSQHIKALSSPLEPAIYGGDRQIGRDSGAIVMDAETLTVDPDETNNPLSCSWRCKVNGQFCYSAKEKGKLISITGCDTVVQSEHFQAGKSYEICVDISKGSRSASTCITLTVVEGNPPKVWVEEPYKKVKASDRIQLEVFFNTNEEPSKMEWSSSQEQGFSYVDLSGIGIAKDYYAGEDSMVTSLLPPYFLKPGSKYRFKLTVTVGSKEGVASVVVEVRTGPTSGSLSAVPSSLQALDLCTLSAPRWSTDSDAGPIKYGFGEYFDGECELFASPSDNPERVELMPQGSGENYILTVCVVVLDKFDTYAMTTFNITSSPPDASDLTEDALDGLFTSNIYDKVQSGDPDAAMGALMSITDTVLDSNETTAELKQSISKKTQGVILQILGNTAVDKDNAVPMLTALRKTDAKAAENRSGMAQAAVKILRGIGDKPLTNEKADETFDWVSDLFDESEENDTSFQEALLDTFDALADNMEEGLFLGDPPREVSNDKVGSMRVQLTNMKDEIVASNKPGAPKFNPGDALAGLFATRKCAGGKKTCTGAIVKFVTLNKKLLVADETKQNKYVDVQDSKVIGIELRDPVNKATVPVTNLAKPLKLTFTVTQAPDGKQLGCVFFDTNRKIWVKEGLIAVEAGNNSLICESLHLTFFAPSNDAKNTSTTAPSTTPAVGATPTEKEKKDLTGAIVGGVIGGLVFIILVILGVWYCTKHKNKNTGRVSPEDPPENAPVE